MIGLRSDVVDYSKWPDLSPEKLESAIAQIVEEVNDAGFEGAWCLTDTGETAEAQVAEAIRSQAPDLILLGAGVRSDNDHFLLFERLINLVHREAPHAGIAFNTNPFDTVEAIHRWT